MWETGGFLNWQQVKYLKRKMTIKAINNQGLTNGEVSTAIWYSFMEKMLQFGSVKKKSLV